MARDAVSVTTITKHTAVNTPAGVAISPTNGANVAAPTKSRKLFLRVTNTITNATKAVTIKAGVYPPAPLQSQGDLTLTVPQSGDIVVTLESGRFLQSDGTINVDFGAGMTGAISAFQLPTNTA